MKRKLLVLAAALAFAAPVFAQTAVVQSLNNYQNRGQTYIAASKAFTMAATPTDACILNGSATKTVYVHRVSVSGVKTTAGLSQVTLFKRSVANTGGTAVAGTEVALDSGNAAATAVYQHYTANSTPGTGTIIYSNYMSFMAPTGISDVQPHVIGFGAGMPQYVVLRGVAQGLAVNLDGATLTGGVLNCVFEWSER